MSKVVVIQDQTLFDIAIQEYGSVEGVIQLAVDNDISITEVLSPGMALDISVEPIDVDIVSYYKAHGLKPATGRSELDVDCLYKGIGYMIIDQDLEVGLKCSDGGIGRWAIDYGFEVSQNEL